MSPFEPIHTREEKEASGVRCYFCKTKWNRTFRKVDHQAMCVECSGVVFEWIVNGETLIPYDAFLQWDRP